MIITYYGKSFIKAQQGDLIVAFNPPNKEADSKVARFGADLALLAMNHPDYNGRETVAYANKSPFVIDGPGEYEIGGIFVEGLPSPGVTGNINTIYTISLDNIKLCHLGGLASANLDDQVVEAIGVVDILFIPIGDEGALAPKDASKLAASLEPKIIIPVSYQAEEKDNGYLKLFLKEMGADGGTVTDKLSIKKKDLEGKEGEVVIIKPS